MMRLAPVVIVCLALVTSPANVQRRPRAAPGVLPRIESYTAPPKDEEARRFGEPYDNFKARGDAVPSHTEALVYDLWLVMTDRLGIEGLTIFRASPDQVEQALQFYLTRRWSQVPGLRAWTHWHFIRSLKPGERRALAREVPAYMRRHGVREP